MCFGSSSKRDTSGSHLDNNLNARPATYSQRISSKTASVSQNVYEMPAGKSPNDENQYAPPPGPPTGHEEQYAPPSSPPPSHHNWQIAVPDTSLLPPPPSIGYQASPTNNATEPEALAAQQWLLHRPLAQPLAITSPDLISPSTTTLTIPPGFSGTLKPLGSGRFHIKTKSGSPDTCFITALPLYSVSRYSPLTTAKKHTIYFETLILPSSHTEISLGIGFLALPYPPFRLPGWERASLGIHGDDGHRYVNDRWGGRDFTVPFKRGEVVGIGMTFSLSQRSGAGSGMGMGMGVEELPTYGSGWEGEAPPVTGPGRIEVEVFFTRNGKREGGWDIHEELDAREDLPVTGLEGFHDLYAAVGAFDAMDFEVRFAERDWLYKL